MQDVTVSNVTVHSHMIMEANMKIIDLLNDNRLHISCELFPPKKWENFEAAKKVVADTAALKPDYMSVTYGATGGTSKYTVDLVDYIQNVQNIPALGHLTCVSSDRETVDNVVNAYKAHGIENILALRGDIPADSGFEPSKDFRHACDLMAEIKSMGDFCIAGACYPEGHPESASVDSDLEFTKLKVEAGCDFLITQMFFDNNILYNYMYKLLKKGIDVPVDAGIMPVTNKSQIARIISLSGNLVPPRFKMIVDRFGDDPEAMKQAGIAYATEQIIDLFANGVNCVHLYTMNHPEIAEAIFRNLSDIAPRKI